MSFDQSLICPVLIGRENDLQSRENHGQIARIVSEAGKGQAALRQDLETLWTEHNSATDGTTSVEAEYLEVIAIRQ